MRKSENITVHKNRTTTEVFTMKTKCWASVLDFKQTVFEFLCQREAENCLLLGIIDRLVKEPKCYDLSYFWTVMQNDQVIGAAWFTPPHPLGLTMMPDDAVSHIFHAVQLIPHQPAEVVGPRASTEAFVKAFRQERGRESLIKFRQKIFQLTEVRPPQCKAGSMRIAQESDLALLTDWNLEFASDCGLSYGSDPRASAHRDAKDAVARQSRYLWLVDGSVVAMASAAGKTPRGIRISFVYTPPSLRGRGYATALVTALSQRMLDTGHEFCFLYTDLANPTSNRIYQKIGYQPVSESAVYSLI